MKRLTEIQRFCLKECGEELQVGIHQTESDFDRLIEKRKVT